MSTPWVSRLVVLKLSHKAHPGIVPMKGLAWICVVAGNGSGNRDSCDSVWFANPATMFHRKCRGVDSETMGEASCRVCWSIYWENLFNAHSKWMEARVMLSSTPRLQLITFKLLSIFGFCGTVMSDNCTPFIWCCLSGIYEKTASNMLDLHLTTPSSNGLVG